MYPGYPSNNNNTNTASYPSASSVLGNNNNNTTASYPFSSNSSNNNNNSNTINNNNNNTGYPGFSSSSNALNNNNNTVTSGYPTGTGAPSSSSSSYPTASTYMSSSMPPVSSSSSITTTTNKSLDINNNNNGNPSSSYQYNLGSSSSNMVSYPTASSAIDTHNRPDNNSQSQQRQSGSRSRRTKTSATSSSSSQPALPSANDYPSAESVYSMLGETSSSRKKSSSSSSPAMPAGYMRQQQQEQVQKHNNSNGSSKSSSSRPSRSSNNTKKTTMHNPVHRPYLLERDYEQGRVRALLIGINYKGQNCELDGCVADVHRQLQTLEQIQFPIDECVVLTDDPKFPKNAGMPTKSTILYWINWLVSDAEKGDVLFFHFSGHGISKKQPPDTPIEEREESGMDQFLIPLDHSKSGMIRDDDLFDLLVSRLPPGVRMTCCVDACKSGSIIDCQFEYRGDSKKFVRVNNKKHGGGDVVVFSAASDFQTAADVSDFGALSKDDPFRGGGAMTAAFNEILTKTAGLTFIEILNEVRRSLRKKKFTQVPQLSATRPIDVSKTFSLFGTLERVQVASYQPPVWTPPKTQIITQSFAFPTSVDQTEWTPPSSSYNISESYYPSASSVIASVARDGGSSGVGLKSVY